MTADEIRALGAEIDRKIRARGDKLAEIARQTGSRESAALLQQVYGDAADIATLTATLKAIDAISPLRVPR